MLKIFRASTSNIFFWAIILLLIVGLAGFGIGTGGLTSAYVARVGDREIDADDYARALDNELRAITAQLGRNLNMEEARQFGVDRVVLARLINDATLDNEADRLGISVGDEAVREQILATPAFRGLDGSFDREAYSFALDRAGLSVRAFEDQVRREIVREMMATAIEAPVAMPDTAALTILGFLGERRAFDWIALGPEDLTEPVQEASEAELVAFYEADPERYVRPETRQITYAALTPEGLAAEIEIGEDELRAAFEARRSVYETPERRIVDRIVFGTADEAAAAMARLDAGEIDFPALAAERELTPEEIDLGFLSEADLPEEARVAVFGAEGPGVVGPAATPLGPALFRINGILPETRRSFEEVREELAEALALEAAGERIRDEVFGIEDLVAGGATVEELADETAMVLGTIELNAETTGGLADDPAFRELAAAAPQGSETDPAEIAGGGIVVLRVDAIEPAQPHPFDEVRERVAADRAADEAARRLSETAEGYAAELQGGLSFADLAGRLGRAPVREGPMTRGETPAQAPAAIVADIFEAEPQGTVIRRDGGRVILAQVAEVRPFDPAEPESAVLFDTVQQQLRQQKAADVLQVFIQTLQARAGVSVNQSVLDRTLERFP
jgi:peptidyl-prolyl cis-trans isomerase D